MDLESHTFWGIKLLTLLKKSFYFTHDFYFPQIWGISIFSQSMYNIYGRIILTWGRLTTIFWPFKSPKAAKREFQVHFTNFSGTLNSKWSLKNFSLFCYFFNNLIFAQFFILHKKKIYNQICLCALMLLFSCFWSLWWGKAMVDCRVFGRGSCGPCLGRAWGGTVSLMRAQVFTKQ